MPEIELFDKRTTLAVHSTEINPNNIKAINAWLFRYGLTFEGGEVLDLRTLPFDKTNFGLRPKGACSAPEGNSSLAKLARTIAQHREVKQKAEQNFHPGVTTLQEALEAGIVVGFSMHAVREAIEACRKDGVERAKIIAVLGEYLDIADIELS